MNPKLSIRVPASPPRFLSKSPDSRFTFLVRLRLEMNRGRWKSILLMIGRWRCVRTFRLNVLRHKTCVMIENLICWSGVFHCTPLVHPQTSVVCTRGDEYTCSFGPYVVLTPKNRLKRAQSDSINDFNCWITTGKTVNDILLNTRQI